MEEPAEAEGPSRGHGMMEAGPGQASPLGTVMKQGFNQA